MNTPRETKVGRQRPILHIAYCLLRTYFGATSAQVFQEQSAEVNWAKVGIQCAVHRTDGTMVKVVIIVAK
jgi:hypothetical protein